MTASVCALLVGLLSQALAGVAAGIGASIVSATFSGAAGTALVGPTLYAKSGVALTLTVVTDTGTNCVLLSGAHSAVATVPVSSDGTTRTWAFALSAVSGADGARPTTATASTDPACATADATATVGYTIDNTPPNVTAAVAPAPNGFGWNKSDISITWSAADGGSGVGSGPTPASDTQTVETGGVIKSSSATDRVGNSHTTSISVKLDKTAPTITGTRSPAANVNGWNNTGVTVNFACSDSRSGIRTCAGPVSFSANGAGQTATGSAADFAGNTSSTNVVVNIDKNAPTISGTPAGSPNSAGWYNGPVTVVWSCSDTGGSGFATNACADSPITGEGTGLSATKSVSDLAGNSSAIATSAPTVNIDKTPPVTTATPSFSGSWSSGPVTVALAAADGLSGVDWTHFTIDGGSDQTYGALDIPTFTTDGAHVLAFWSMDVAGNEETHHTLTVNVDGSAPTITTSQAPAPNSNGWNNESVVVSFSCSDLVSGIASCPADASLFGDGAAQSLTGTAVDLAGNSASATAFVSIDETPPTITGSVSPAANGFGWNNTSVIVSYSCGDALSGVESCAANQTLIGEGSGQSATGGATDLAGNSASTTVSGINIDTTPPDVAVLGVVDSATYDEGGYSASCSSSDGLSGIATDPVLSESGGPTGPVTLTCSGAADRAGNVQARPVSVTINVRAPVDAYQFGGFLRPVVGGAVNAVTAGSAVPLKFSLGGFRGMNILAAGFPASVSYTCGTAPPTAATEPTTSNGGLTYDAASDTYGYVWKTVKAWTGCRMLQIRFSDGSVARAYFSFR